MKLFGEIPSEKPIFKDELSLDFDYIPNEIILRDNELKEIANNINPLIFRKKASNVLVYGNPGIGKTMCVKKVLDELNKHTNKIKTIYMNCWKTPTKHYFLTELAKKLGLVFLGGKGSDFLLSQIVKKLKKEEGFVLVLDEADKIPDLSFLYILLEELSNSCYVFVANSKEFLTKLDPRIRSRLILNELKFRDYLLKEIIEILELRSKIAFEDGVISKETIEKVAIEVDKNKDLRVGLAILRELGRTAERSNDDKITDEHLKEVLKKVENLRLKSSLPNLKDDEKVILEIIKNNPGIKSGELYNKVKNKIELSERSIRRVINNLENRGFIITKETGKGYRGKSKIMFLK